jgi:hypothetical protein
MNDAATIEMQMPEDTTQRDKLSIPLDLSEWVPVSELRDWIMTDVATLDWTNPELIDLLRQFPDFEPKALLNTMTLGYATGIFAAEEIARRCSTDVEFRGARPKLPPVAVELKAFRRENRGVLKWALVKVITRAFRTQFIDGDSFQNLPAGLRRAVLANASERLDLARHMDRTGDL